jgi:hypothetical protein
MTLKDSKDTYAIFTFGPIRTQTASQNDHEGARDFAAFLKGIPCNFSITSGQDPSVLSRHSAMPLAGIQSGVFLDSGQNRAGMTKGSACG